MSSDPMKHTYDTSVLKKDFTPTGIKMEGQYENDRNLVFSDLFKDIIREVYGAGAAHFDVIVAHHLTYVRVETRADGFQYQVIQEIPSADALIFDHEVAAAIWGADRFFTILPLLALAPIEQRDKLLAALYYGRPASLKWTSKDIPPL